MEPEFCFFRPGRDRPLILTDPDDVEIFPRHGTRGPSATAPAEDDPFDRVDRFFEGFSSGVVAGWFCYELGAWNHDLPLPERNTDTPPLLLLAHYPDVDHSIPDTGKPTIPSLSRFDSTLSSGEYQERVRTIHQHIQQGYVYQVNISQRFAATMEGTLRSLLPFLPEWELPPHSVYAGYRDFEILSLSPERFLSVDGERIRSQPIKGTRRRSQDPVVDGRRARDLQASTKDRAEHVMIVDLIRNDLNRICRVGSVEVSERWDCRSFPTVHHLVSTVEGRLMRRITPGRIFRECFPGGSITGAPKYTALRLIDRLETRNRGIYTGTIGYWDLDRDQADWNIAIRTLVRRGSRAWWDAGGGIVQDSDPDAEHRESLDKVAILNRLRNQLGPESPVASIR